MQFLKLSTLRLMLLAGFCSHLAAVNEFDQIRVQMQKLHRDLVTGTESSDRLVNILAPKVKSLFMVTDKNKKPFAEKILHDTFKAILYRVGAVSETAHILKQTAHGAAFGIQSQLQSHIASRAPSELEQILKEAQDILVAYSADLGILLKKIETLNQHERQQLQESYIQSLNRQALCLYDLLRNYKN